MSERKELRIRLLELGGSISACWCDLHNAGPFDQQSAEAAVDATVEQILAAGYRKPRTLTTPDEANALPDRSAFVTPGEIIFRKWENYWGEGKHGWERELGNVVPAELLSAEGHFPATVLWEPTP